jgi:ADP-ribose pyrophosphatase YjhB (NUDIX family)
MMRENMSVLLAGGVILDERNRVLLIHRNTPEIQQWELPGKTMKHGETPEQALRRGMETGLGVDVWVGDLLGETQFTQESKHIHSAWMTAKILDDQDPKIKQKDYDTYGYFELGSLEHLKQQGVLSPNVEKLIQTIDDNDIELRSW